MRKQAPQEEALCLVWSCSLYSWRGDETEEPGQWQRLQFLSARGGAMGFTETAEGWSPAHSLQERKLRHKDWSRCGVRAPPRADFKELRGAVGRRGRRFRHASAQRRNFLRLCAFLGAPCCHFFSP